MMQRSLSNSSNASGHYVQKLKDTTIDLENMSPKLVVLMVGLPARGKSYIVKRLLRYLNWLGLTTKVFNVGNTRRMLRSSKTSDIDKQEHRHEFFDDSNVKAKKQREYIAELTLEELLNFLKSKQGKIAIYDATNTTIQRRKNLKDRLKKEGNINMLFVESICDKQEVLKKNIEMKLNGPDYSHMPREKALTDFVNRIKKYEEVYQPIDESEDPDIMYCKIINVGKKIIAYNINGYLQSQVVYYLMNMNLEPRKIWLTRHGESEDNRAGKIGGDSSLTQEGREYAKHLNKFIQQKRQQELDYLVNELNRDISNINKMQIWTSMLKRTIETVQYFDTSKFDVMHYKPLNEIHAGDCEGLSYHEIKQKYPNEYKNRKNNKMTYRYFGLLGESYIDVVHRLNPVIIELERSTCSVLLVSHNAVIRILLAYMLDLDLDKAINFDMPLGTVICLEPKPYGTEISRFKFIEETKEFIQIENNTKNIID